MRELMWSRLGLTLEAARALYDPVEFSDILTFFRIEAEERNSKGSGGGARQDPAEVDAAFAQLPRIERPPMAAR
jgi:hypothetical protein